MTVSYLLKIQLEKFGIKLITQKVHYKHAFTSWINNSKQIRKLSGEHEGDQMSIDFIQIFSLWLKSNTYHPPLPSVG